MKLYIRSLEEKEGIKENLRIAQKNILCKE